MLTMLESSKLTDNPLQSGVVEIFATNNPVLERMPFVDIQGNSYRYNREGTLPGIAFRGVNESYTESTGMVNPVTEALTICGGDSDYDTFIAATSAESRAIHDAMKAKALSLTWFKTFFDGDSASDPREFDGLNARLTGDQVVDAGTGGAALTLAKLDELIDAVQGTPTALLMNKTMRRKVNTLVRASGAAIETVSDAFGRQLQAYAGIPIAVVEDDASGNAILGFDEDDGSGNPDTTSIYAVRFGADALHGIQTAAMSVRDLGELKTKPAFRTRIEWFSGLVVKHPRAAARLIHVNNA